MQTKTGFRSATLEMRWKVGLDRGWGIREDSCLMRCLDNYGTQSLGRGVNSVILLNEMKYRFASRPLRKNKSPANEDS